MAVTPSLQSLHPTGTTSQEIRAAFFRLTEARRANNEAITAAAAARPNLVLDLSPAQLRKHDEEVRDRHAFAEQLDALETKFRRMFDETKAAEDDLAYADRLAAIRAAEKAWNAEMGTRYPALTAELAELLRREVAILTQYIELARMPAASRALGSRGSNFPFLTSGMLRAKHGARFSPQHFNEALSLPTIAPAEAAL